MTREYLKVCQDVLLEAARVYADSVEGRSDADPLLAGGRARAAMKEWRRAELAVRDGGVPLRRYGRELGTSEIRSAKRLKPNG